MENKRKVDTKDNYFSLELKEAEIVCVKVGDDDVISFYVPYNCTLAAYVKKEVMPLQYQKGKLF